MDKRWLVVLAIRACPTNWGGGGVSLLTHSCVNRKSSLGVTDNFKTKLTENSKWSVTFDSFCFIYQPKQQRSNWCTYYITCPFQEQFTKSYLHKEVTWLLLSTCLMWCLATDIDCCVGWLWVPLAADAAAADVHYCICMSIFDLL